MSAQDIPLLTITRRIAMRDTDAAGILYLAAPYAWEEELWTGLLYEIGRPLSGLLVKGVGAPVVASSATYHAPVTLDSILKCQLYAEDIGRTSFGLRMEAVLPAGDVAVTVNTRHVWCTVVEGTLGSAPIPEWLLDTLGPQNAS